MFVIDFSPHLPKKTYPVRNVRISTDSGTLAATFGKEGRAEHAAWWSLTDGKLIGSSSIFPPEWDEDSYTETFVEPVFTPDLSRCAVHGYAPGSGSVEFHFVMMVAPNETLDDSVGFSFAPDREEETLQSLAITPDGKRLLAGHGRGTFSRWELKKSMFGKTVDRSQHFTGDEYALEVEDEADETALAISPDGKRIACGLSHSPVRLYVFKSGKPVAEFEDVVSYQAAPEVRGLVFSPNGERSAVRAGGWVTILDVKAEQAETVLKPRKHLDLAFTPDGRRLFTGGSDKLVRVWDTATWQETARFDWKIGAIHSVTVSPDGAIAAAGGDKGRVVVWDLEE